MTSRSTPTGRLSSKGPNIQNITPKTTEFRKIRDAFIGFKDVTPVPCEHIRAYYNHLWEGHHCIGWNLLRRGYRQWSEGRVESANNLYGDV